MNVQEAIYHRRSIRQFEDRPIDPDLIELILDTALQSPSWSNTQPYKVAVASGELCDQLRVAMTEKFDRATSAQKLSLPGKLWAVATRKVMPDGDFNTRLSYPEELQERRVATGVGLYQLLGIERHDTASRHQQYRRNFEFFDAPVVLFVFVHEEAKEYAALDAGIFLQSLVLAATEHGVGSCIQGSVATWRSPLEEHFSIPRGYKLICGVALGYAAQSRVNEFKPGRIARESLVIAASGSSCKGT